MRDPRASNPRHRITIQYAVPDDPEAFDAHYRDVHVPLVAPIPGLRRFTTSRPRGLGGAAPYFVAELWFDDGDALKAALRSPEMAAAGADAEGLGVPMTMFSGEVVEAR
ncbi:MAG: EthD family reductase [Nocardioides sp.]